MTPQRKLRLKPTVIDAREAGKLIKDGATVTVCGVSGTMVPDLTLAGIEASFLSTGHPKDMTLFFPMLFGYATTDGADHFGNKGMLKRVIGGSFHGGPGTVHKNDLYAPKLCTLVKEDLIEAYVFPLGVSYKLVRDISAGLPGTFSYVGLGTIIDPRNGGGKLNPRTKEDMVEIIKVQGREMLFYKAFPIDVAIIRGTTADELGNISLEEESITTEVLHMAIAAHNSGGIVICQVRRLAAAGSLNPRTVEVPGMLVDYIVVDPKQKQNTSTPDYNPAISGEIRVPLPPIVSMPLNADKVISRRALMELAPGMIVNLGGGLPTRGGLPMVAREENIAQNVHFTIEHGALGGLCPGHINPTAFFTACDVMDLYHGSGLNQTFLGFMEIDSFGNANLGRLGDFTDGPGGCIDIATCTPRVGFVGSFTYGGLEVEVANGKLNIVKEGKAKKFVKKVQGAFFNSKYGTPKNQKVKYITERAVFELQGEGVTLTEFAPGVDVEKDILNQMEFKPVIARDLKEMNPKLFLEPRLGIGDKW